MFIQWCPIFFSFKLMLRKISFTLLLIACSLLIKAQDPMYSQFFVNPSLINPAFTGNTYGPYVSLLSRVQWKNHQNPYNSVSIGYSQKINDASGIGAYLTSDRTSNGGIFSNKLEAAYSFQVELSRETFLKSGASLGYVLQSLSPEKFIFYDNIDPRYGPVSPGGTEYPTAENLENFESNNYFDLAAGVLLYNPRYYGGISLKHINRPEINFIQGEDNEGDNKGYLLSLQAGMNIDLPQLGYENTFFSPSIMFLNAAESWSALVGGYINVDDVFGGFWFRQDKNSSDAIIGMLGVKYGILKISYSYDYTVSKLSIGGGGSHEVGLSFNFDELRPQRSKYSDCFEAFR